MARATHQTRLTRAVALEALEAAETSGFESELRGTPERHSNGATRIPEELLSNAVQYHADGTLSRERGRN
jgi:hypothetical protein